MTSVRNSGLYSGTQIDKRVFEIFKNQEVKIQEQEVKIQVQEVKIQDQDLEIHRQRDTLEYAQRYLPYQGSLKKDPTS